MKRVLAAAAAMVLTAATPAAATTFEFNFSTLAGGTSGTNSGNVYGNFRTFTLTNGGETMQMRVSAFSVAANGAVSSAYVGRYDNGLGVINTTDGGSNYHAVDNIGSTDFLVFQLSQVASATSATTVAYAGDSDFMARLGTSTVAWNQSIGGSNLPVQYSKQVNGNTTQGVAIARSLFAAQQQGNLLIIRAGGTDAAADAFKLRGITFVTPPVTPVPEPATWAMMIAGFGLVGAGLRRRGATTTVTA